jgi:two-component system sensor histidine kinase BaeS
VTVADTGSGIAPDLLPRVMDRFVRGDASRARSTGGSGLGLAIASAIVEAHGGSIVIDSAPGQGTTVTIELTLPESARVPSRAALDATPAPDRRQPVAPA